MKSKRKTKTEIYATFGPSCGTESILKDMIDAGLTGMRLNLSHTTLTASSAYIRAYQKAAEESGVTPQILIDMQGPELRIGNLEKPLLLEDGQLITLQKESIPVPDAVMQAVKPGDQVLLDDGKIQICIVDTSMADTFDKNEHLKNKKSIRAKVLRGGLLHSHKSIKILNTNVAMPVLTEHDLENIRLASSYGVTALMQPFVLNGADLAYVRQILKENGAENIQIFAKIENRLGVENLESIIPEADVIIIARGDLGNDMPLWELPAVQKKIERICSKYGKPYIVVTQMLASMEKSPVPTRAEVSDIFHAVLHGACGVMITGESAIGAYPVEAVQYLANTALEAENILSNK